MPRTVHKTLTFPLAGVSRRRGHRETPRPYAAPWAINVRGVCPLARRDRGGSRPALTKVNATDFGSSITLIHPLTSIDASGNLQHDLVIIADGAFSYLRGAAVSTIGTQLQWPDGQTILWEDGEEIIFDATVAASSPIGATDAYHAASRGGKLYLADSTVKVYDPNTGIVENVLATAGTVPTLQPLIAFYRERMILSGANHIWYAARTATPSDFDYGAEMTDASRAVAGQLEHASGIGAIPKALIPFRDKSLVFACENSLWILRGDPATGVVDAVSEEIGVIAPEAWAKTPDGVMAFLSNDGVYVWDLNGGLPVRFSEERVPDELRNLSPTDNQITMSYDPVGRGFNLFITPVDGSSGTHWWLDLDNKAMWPVVFHALHQPLAVARAELGNGLAEVIVGCQDGYLRKFDASAESDDGIPVESHVLLGPFRISANDVEDSVLAEIHGIMADNDDFVTWRIVSSDSAERASDLAYDGINAILAGEDPVGVQASGRWAGLRNKVDRPRVRGPWVIVWLSASSRWSYEAVAIVAKQLGRLR